MDTLPIGLSRPAPHTGPEMRDGLTGLPGRLALMERMRLGDGAGGPVALLVLNLDRFAALVDRHGPAVADLVLCHTAARLRTATPDHAFLTRLDRDEFALLLPGTRPDQVAALAGRLIAACAAPFGAAGLSVKVSASIGIALGHESGLDPDAMLQQAMAALHGAKAGGGGTHRFFEPGLEQSNRHFAALQAELRRALRRHQFELNYQPQFDILTGRPCGVEALLRWHHPEMGVVAPGTFIGVAETSGLIVPIGRWVSRAACEQAAHWGSVHLSVNLSPIQLRDPGLVRDIAASLSETGLAADQLDLEITEGVFLHDSPSTISQLERLRALGVGITLDDFGTGYSSLSYLRLFPFTKLKIDRSFVAPATGDRAAACIIQSMVALGRTLGMRVNAEGVETPAQLQLLKDAGCDEVQGFLLARPMPAQQLTALLGALDEPYRSTP